MTWFQLLSISALCISFSAWGKQENICADLEKTYTIWAGKQRFSSNKKQFIRVMSWGVWQENYRILKSRLLLSAITEKYHKKKQLTTEEKAFLKHACAYYKVSNWKYLCDRMDVVPISMAVAQSIQECGWGKSSGCVNKNAYFGMSRSGVCHQYNTLEHSIRAYVRTLNTHRGYVSFRTKRRIMREREQNILGVALVQELRCYCTDSGYTTLIQYIIRKYRLSVFDLMMSNIYRDQLSQESVKRNILELTKHTQGTKIVAQALWGSIYEKLSNWLARSYCEVGAMKVA